MQGSSRRRPGKLDAVASLVAKALPAICTPAIDQARLDTKMVLDRLGGRAPHSVIANGSSAVPLEEVDPLLLLPRGVAERVRAASRDLEMLGGRLLFGRTPSPLVSRSARPEGAVVPLRGVAPRLARTVRVVDVVRETPDAVSIYLTEEDGSPIEFDPGQFLSVHVEVGGERLRRAYSLANACLPDVPVHITVKRIPEGRVSNQLNDTIRKGDALEVLGPSGNFTIEPHASKERHLVMVAGGSGITPVMCLIETALEVEERTRVTLVYGNHGWDDIIFRERLARLSERFEGRLIVEHVLQHPPESWTGAVGLLSAEILAERLDALGIEDDGSLHYFVCGPTPMMDATHAVLEQRGVERLRIREERFLRPEARHESAGSEQIERVVVAKNGSEYDLPVAPGQTILEAALAAGLDLPFSCALGGCGACRVRLRDGEIRMDEPNCLSRSERAEGYVLTCVGRPLAQSTIEVEFS